MAKTASTLDAKVAELTTAVNRRKQAIEKIGAGKSSAVDVRHVRKLLKQAQRRRRKLVAEQARRGVAKPAEGDAPAPEVTEASAAT